ncbi:MAG TPA: thermonuclease family protein [Thalassobaculum sp.]
MRPAHLLAAALAATAVFGFAVADSRADVKGRARVLSGDTIVIGRDIVRLHGIDAPEEGQYCENEYGRPFECGVQALDTLQDMIGSRAVTCVGEQVDGEGRLLAICYAGDTNLNSRMVRTGWAVARPAEQPDFVSLERLARGERAGIWALKFQDPAEWRKANP